MAITVPEAQQGKTGSLVTSLATGAFATSPSVGDLIVVFCATEAGGSTHTAPTDSAGHTATQCGSESSASGEQLSVWRFENLTTGTGLGSYVVTGHFGTAASATIIAVRVTGNAAAAYNSDIVQNSLTTLTSAANPSVGPTTVAPASASIFFGVLASNNAGNAQYTDGTNIAWTHITNETQTDNTSFDDLYVEHFINTDATKRTAQWVTATVTTWFAAVLSFAPSGAVVAQVAYQPQYHRAPVMAQ